MKEKYNNRAVLYINPTDYQKTPIYNKRSVFFSVTNVTDKSLFVQYIFDICEPQNILIGDRVCVYLQFNLHGCFYKGRLFLVLIFLVVR